ncbi:hypothetical protein GR247_07905 [Rhizobium leguminosarum]|nr:hypothetical protein [Rhizobium leguminosarum]
MPFSPNAATVFADGPPSNPYEPPKHEIRKLLTSYETILDVFASGGSNYAKATRAQLFSDLAHAADTTAWVYADPIIAYNGIYIKAGASGSGSWSLILPLPYSFITATNAGTGTANAIEATTDIPISAEALIVLNIYETNSGSPVTVSFNGDTPLTVKTTSGNDVVPGGLTAEMRVLGTADSTIFRLVSDQTSAAIQAAAEYAAAEAAVYRDDAEAAAGSLLFRIYATVAGAQAATIAATASYIAIAEFSPQPRFYKRFGSDPGSGDRFQSTDGAWWQGLPLPPTALDFANAVARSANATLGAGDLDQVHIWTIGVGTTYTATLPDPDTYLGRLIHIEVDASSRGLLALACVDPIGLFVTGDMVLWAGESMTLVARPGRWEIIGGRCIPCTLYATNPGANITVTGSSTTFSVGWITTLAGGIHPGAEWAINASGALVIPRKGFYGLTFSAGFSWATTPTSNRISCNTAGGMEASWGGGQQGAGINAILHDEEIRSFEKGDVLSPLAASTGGSSVIVDRVTLGAPRFTMVESPQW